MKLPLSVLQKIQSNFGQESQKRIEELLSGYGEESYQQEQERVLLDLLKLTKGDEKELTELLERAKCDYRDIIFWAEHPEESKLDTKEKVQAFNAVLEKLGVNFRIPKKEDET